MGLKINPFQSRPPNTNVTTRGLVVENPRTRDIIKFHNSYYKNLTEVNFGGEVLVYVTPVSVWNNYSPISLLPGITTCIEKFYQQTWYLENIVSLSVEASVEVTQLVTPTGLDRVVSYIETKLWYLQSLLTCQLPECIILFFL